MRASTLADWLWIFAIFFLVTGGARVLAHLEVRSEPTPAAPLAVQQAAPEAAPQAAAATASAAALPTVDEIIEKHIAARGGAEKLAAIQTLMVTGRLQVGAEPGEAITVRLRRPNQLRQDFILQMRTGTRAYDGATGWERLPSATGRATVQSIDGLALDDIRAEAENGIDGPLVHYREKGHRVEVAGLETFNGARCYALIVHLKTGQVIRPFVDVSTFLLAGERRTRMIPGRGMVGIEERVGDHRPVAGVLFPHLYESGPSEDPREMRLKVERIVANPVSPAIDESIFRSPAAAQP